MILFLDIDGVLLPGRAYYMASQTQPLVTRFDPCVVGMVNKLCAEIDAKIVIHSNWRRTEPRRIARGARSLREHFINEGILPENLHPNVLCPMKFSSSRWMDISAWLEEHPEVGPEDFFVLEDEDCPTDWPHASRVIQCDFDNGLTVAQYMDMVDRVKPGKGRLILPPGY